MAKRPGRPKNKNTDQSKPWSIRGISHETRSAATKAARDSKTPIGEWVERALQNEIQNQYAQPETKTELGPTSDEMLQQLLKSQEALAKRLDDMNEHQSKPLLARLLGKR